MGSEEFFNFRNSSNSEQRDSQFSLASYTPISLWIVISRPFRGRNYEYKEQCAMTENSNYTVNSIRTQSLSQPSSKISAHTADAESTGSGRGRHEIESTLTNEKLLLTRFINFALE